MQFFDENMQVMSADPYKKCTVAAVCDRREFSALGNAEVLLGRGWLQSACGDERGKKRQYEGPTPPMAMHLRKLGSGSRPRN